jgi:hypothetical protein
MFYSILQLIISWFSKKQGRFRWRYICGGAYLLERMVGCDAINKIWAGGSAMCYVDIIARE